MELERGTAEGDPASGLGESDHARDMVSTPRRPSLRSLAFPPVPFSATCRLLLQQYPCLRSPAVLARMLQGGEFDEKQPDEVPRTVPLQSADGTCWKATGTAAANAGLFTTGSPLKGGEALQQRDGVVAAAVAERESFASSIRLHFRGLGALAAQLAEGQSACSATAGVMACSARTSWSDIGGRLATTGAGAAAVEAGLAPWEAAELFADVFKTSVLGLCATTELHLIFLAAVSIGGEMQPHWQSYLSIYDGLEPASRRVADFLGIRREVICNEAVKAQGAVRRCANDIADLLVADRLTFANLRSRITIETHRRFFFALLLNAIYREGESYEAVMRRFGVTKCAMLTCMSQGALVCAIVASFLRFLRPQEAALSEVCFMLAGRLKIACLPMGRLASTLIAPTALQSQPGFSGPSVDGPETAAALQQLLQLDGMTPRRAAALRAAHINSCADLTNAPVYDVFKALEATEPAPLIPAAAQRHQAAWMYKRRRQHARLLAVTVKLKDAARQEQAMRLQALEDEAAGHWSLVGKVIEESGDEKETWGGEE